MLDVVSTLVILASVAMAVLGCLFLALARFARDGHPYECCLYEFFRKRLAPRQIILFRIGLGFFLISALLLAYLLLSRLGK